MRAQTLLALSFGLGLALDPASAEKIVQGPSFLEPKSNGVAGTYVDDLLEALRQRPPSPGVKQVATAWKAARKRNFETVRSVGEKLTRDTLYGDYGLWFLAEAHTALSERASLESGRRHLFEARDALGRISLNRPDSPLAKKGLEQMAQVEFRLALLAHKQSRSTSVQSWFVLGLSRLLQTGQFFAQKVPVSALDAYLMACQKKPEPNCGLWARRLLGAFPKEGKEYKMIASHYPALVQKPEQEAYVDFSKTYKAPDLDQVAIDEALAAYFRRDYGVAAEKFEQHLQSFPQSTHRHRARFWAGRSHEKDREPERGRFHFEEVLKAAPLTYYGLMAAKAIGVPVETRIDAVLPLAAPQDEALDPIERVRLLRAEELFAQGIPELASVELDSLTARREMSGAFLMYLAALNHECLNYGTSFKQVGDLIQRGNKGVVSTYGLRLIFPLLHYEQIQRYAEAVQLDPLLVLSLMKQESAFRASALSRSGATGLMQLMPFTAVAVEPDIEQAELLVAENSIRIGSKYLAEMVTKFDGNWVQALGAYNAGPTRMSRWKKEAQPHWDMLEFIESISYTETREYVAAIVRNYYWYSYRLSQKRPDDFSIFWRTKPQNGSE